MAHVGGKKVSKSHSTVIDAAMPVVRVLQKYSGVSNIVLGKIDVYLPTTAWRLKYTIISGGVKLVVRGSTSIQTLYVYTQNAEGLFEYIREKLSGDFILNQ